MSRKIHLAIQMLAISAQSLNILFPILSEKAKLIVTFIISAAQGSLGILAHEFNPDGTTCKTSYTKENYDNFK